MPARERLDRVNRWAANHRWRCATLFGVNFAAMWFLLNYVLLRAAGEKPPLGLSVFGGLLIGALSFLGGLVLATKARDHVSEEEPPSG
jgi:hypothetical protein